MSEIPDFRSAVSDYSAAIEPILRRSTLFVPAMESTFAVQVERGEVLPEVMAGNGAKRDNLVERLIVLALGGRHHEAVIVDQSGHQRSVYRPLLVYAWLLAFKLEYEKLSRETFGRWEEALRIWCDGLEATLARVGGDSIPASAGAQAAESAWTALALHVAGRLFIRDAWTDLASDMFGRLARVQRPAGTFLEASGSDNPEVAWYHELQILNAAASYAVQAEDRTVAAAVQRATAFHVAETQPDHASAQPWGLFAFIWNAEARSLADQVLHAVSMQSEPDGVSLILLAESLYCLRLFL